MMMTMICYIYLCVRLRECYDYVFYLANLFGW
jgi:hypothetical protein